MDIFAELRASRGQEIVRVRGGGNRVTVSDQVVTMKTIESGVEAQAQAQAHFRTN